MEARVEGEEVWDGKEEEPGERREGGWEREEVARGMRLELRRKIKCRVEKERKCCDGMEIG